MFPLSLLHTSLNCDLNRYAYNTYPRNLSSLGIPQLCSIGGKEPIAHCYSSLARSSCSQGTDTRRILWSSFFVSFAGVYTMERRSTFYVRQTRVLARGRCVHARLTQARADCKSRQSVPPPPSMPSNARNPRNNPYARTLRSTGGILAFSKHTWDWINISFSLWNSALV